MENIVPVDKFPHRFKPGQSGNPSGRPKRTLEEKAALDEIRKLTPAAVKTLKEILTDKHASVNMKLKAIEIVLDRAYGRPETRSNVSIGNQQEDFVLKITPSDDWPEPMPYDRSTD